MRKAWGYGVATIAANGDLLDVWFSDLALAPLTATSDLSALLHADAVRRVTKKLVEIEIDLDSPPVSAEDAYLRLHLLSHRLVAPHGVNLDGVFGLLTNVVWTSHGPCSLVDFEQVRIALRAAHGHVTVFGVDKFPRMVDYIVPEGVRIADADRAAVPSPCSSGWSATAPTSAVAHRSWALSAVAVKKLLLLANVVCSALIRGLASHLETTA